MSTTPVKVTGGRQAWTRERIIEKIREWHSLYGEPPRAADWNPSAAKWSGQPWRIERYRAGDWPSLNAAKRVFGGSLNAAILAAGFEPHKPGPKRRGEQAPVVAMVNVPPDAKAAIRDLQAALREAEEKIAARDRMLEREREAARRARTERDAARRERSDTPASVPKVKTVTRTEKVRVEDTRKVARLERRLERAEMLREQAEAAVALVKAEARETTKMAARDRKAAEAARAALEEASVEVAEATRARAAAEDRVVAAEAEARRERVVVQERVVRSASDAEVAEAREAVARMEREVHEAEVRAARAERLMREQGAAVTGEMRRLTADEVRELRARGPSGPAVVMQAVKEVAAVKANKPKLTAALTKLASAAITWRESL